jgi:hypothetical protein
MGARISDAMQAELQQLAAEQNGGQATFDMANLRPDRTGLPYVVFISQKGFIRHDVRIKLARAAKVRPSEMPTGRCPSVSSAHPRRMNREEFDLVKRWIELNRNVLIDYWNGDIEYTEDALAAITPLNHQWCKPDR